MSRSKPRHTLSERSAVAGFNRAMGRLPQRVNPFGQAVNTHPKALDAGALYTFWHPDREGVESCPADFQAKLNEIGGFDERGREKLRCVKPPAGAPIRCHGWLVFVRKPEITHWLSPGWLLVLAWNNGVEPTPKPLPLDNRILANLYLQSLKGGREVFGRDFDSAVQYFDHVVAVMHRDKQKQEAANAQYNKDRQRDHWDYTKIKNIGHGSKFALHHDGTVMPTRNEANWVRERQADLPSDVAARDRDEIKRAKGRTQVDAPDKHKVWQSQMDRQMHDLRMGQRIRELAKERRRSTVAVSR